ncbi:MAG TPA: hypothetical protein DIS79_05385 [Bacteroidetes bacterium]|nr:hypothetical protein [Bacteroidota bacterium]
MDRNSIIGMVLIGLIVGIWMFFQSTMQTTDVTPEQTARRREVADSSAIVARTGQSEPKDVQLFEPAPERTLTIVTDVLRVRLSSRGATIRSWQLNDYRPWYKDIDTLARVDLIQPGAHEFGFNFRTVNGAKISAPMVPFVWDVPTDSIRVTGSSTVTIRGTAKTVTGGTIVRTYTFSGSTYDVRTEFTMEKLNDVIPAANRLVNLGWSHGIRYQEKSSVDESNNAVAMITTSGDIAEIDASDYRIDDTTAITGRIEWLATRSKYFTVALLPPLNFDGQAEVRGRKYGAPDDGSIEKFSLTVRVPYRGERTTQKLTLYAGPMQYDTLARYGLTDVMNFGWKWIVKPIGEYFMLPVLKLIHTGIPNYGVAIILFAILMKLLLYPLSITQMKSAQKMKLLAPLMTDIREKYKDDQQRQSQETMKLYAEYGINPAGGCLPLLLQMPFLYALYSVLNLNIELRQAAFLDVWLTDLSVPDVIFELPFKLPLFNIDKFSGLALVMGATLFIQQKQAITDPRQKAMVYLMPVMLTLMFSTLPAGLNLYYFIFNVLGIAQQLWMTKFSRNQPTLAELKAMPKKESWLQKRMALMQEMAEQQRQAGGSGSGAARPRSPRNENRSNGKSGKNRR